MKLVILAFVFLQALCADSWAQQNRPFTQADKDLIGASFGGQLKYELERIGVAAELNDTCVVFLPKSTVRFSPIQVPLPMKNGGALQAPFHSFALWDRVRKTDAVLYHLYHELDSIYGVPHRVGDTEDGNGVTLALAPREMFPTAIEVANKRAALENKMDIAPGKKVSNYTYVGLPFFLPGHSWFPQISQNDLETTCIRDVNHVTECFCVGTRNAMPKVSP